ncbi:MAG: TrkA family potassium uptake protein [Deltaproteobacteria bacterium]|nr:TrkA family potassium uptake protein [Deltaproteobacteria bacterium]
MKKKEAAIIGLGKFGLTLGQSLVGLGHPVVGVDASKDKVRNAQDILTHVFEADATNPEVIRQLGLAEMPVVIVSVGQSLEKSVLIVLHLKEAGVDQVWVKAISTDHEKVLRKIGADHIIFPERYAAEQLARKLVVPGLIDYLPFGKNVVLQEIEVKKIAGQSLRSLDLTNQFGVQVVAVKTGSDDEFRFIPKADDILKKGDILVVLGKEESVATLNA